MATKKYISLDRLSYFLDNLKNVFSSISHTHTQSDIEDLVIDNTVSASANLVRNSAVNTAINNVRDEIESRLTSIGFKNNDIPKIYIDGDIPATKDEVDAKLTYVSGIQRFDSYIKIKCQGNSSMAYPKKNFTIKLYKDAEYNEKFKIDLKGWGEQSKFVLKANWIDYSHARNVVSARIWSQMVETRSDYDSLPEELKSSPNNGAVDGFPVIVYCNGVYYGRYTLNIPKDKWLLNMDDESNNHCLLASENYVSGCFRATANIDGTDWTDEIHDVVPSNIMTSFNDTIDFVMNSTDEEFVANIGYHFNLLSLIDYYILCYVICHLDGLGKNQLMYTYDGVCWFAGAYDMDSTFGLYWDGSNFVSDKYKMQSEYETGVNGTTNLLYERLEKLFKEEIKERYIELRETVLNEINMIQMFEDFTDLIPPYKCEEDFHSTTANGAFRNMPSTSSNHIGQIREYIVKRLNYVDSKINSNTVSGFTTLRENFMPMGTSWIDTVNLDLNNGDYIEISVNLGSCTGTNENIISIGDNIAGWEQNVAGYHMYFSKGYSNSGTMEIWSFIGSNSNRKTITVSTATTTIIKVDVNGVSINGNIQQTGKLQNINNIQIGSMEGTTRSRAIYNYIKVYKEA